MTAVVVQVVSVVRVMSRTKLRNLMRWRRWLGARKSIYVQEGEYVVMLRIEVGDRLFHPNPKPFTVVAAAVIKTGCKASCLVSWYIGHSRVNTA